MASGQRRMRWQRVSSVTSGHNDMQQPRRVVAIQTVSMSTFTSILTGIGIGLATSVTAWFLTLVFLAPRLRIEELLPRDEGATQPKYQFRIASRRRRRDLMSVEVHCDLRIPHNTVQENVLMLQVSSNGFPLVPAGWQREITVSMDPRSLTDFGQAQLAKRLAELEPKMVPTEISSLRDIFRLIPGSRIEIIVFASDPLSGARRASRASLIPGP